MLTGTLSGGTVNGTVSAGQELTGTVQAAGSLEGTLSASGTLSGVMSSYGTLTGEIANPTEIYVYDYNRLDNKPSINGVELINDKSFEDLGVRTMTNFEILAVFNRVFGGD